MSEWKKHDLVEWIGRKKLRWLMHLVFWLAVMIFYTVFFGYQNVNYNITFSFVIVLLPVTILTTYFLNYELIPNFLFKKRYLKFFLYFIYTLIISFYIEMVTVIAIFVLVAELHMDELQPSATNAVFLIAGMYVVVFLGVALKLVNQYNKNQTEIQRLSREKIEAELKFLKTQLHPHFLFNTLNNLYALTLEKSDMAADVVLKLSELLDYVLYKCSGEFVPIESEADQIANYIELEKLRYGERLKLDFNRQTLQPRTMIPPMLLLTLVENSFKHGAAKTNENSWIKIELESDNEWVRFDISNSKANARSARQESSGGIGLKNVLNRLELIYKNDFDIDITDSETSFGISLKFKAFLAS
ncbi:MAG: histidine kinase [Cyclobacteriaceae bacterium]|nr:histidine kinase [Cyclobacteriaceae bacterium]